MKLSALGFRAHYNYLKAKQGMFLKKKANHWCQIKPYNLKNITYKFNEKDKKKEKKPTDFKCSLTSARMK